MPYQHNPYSVCEPTKMFHRTKVTTTRAKSALAAAFTGNEDVVAMPAAAAPQPSAAAATATYVHDHTTLHIELASQVTFVPYPASANDLAYAAEAERDLAEAAAQHDPLQRVFLGQLPLKSARMQLQWLFRTFAGVVLHDLERITKRNAKGGARLPTGCVHAMCRASKIDAAIAATHKRILIDDSGCWVAMDGNANASEEQAALNAYCAMLKGDATKRFRERPNDTIVVQRAQSAFQSAAPRWVSNEPAKEKFAPSPVPVLSKVPSFQLPPLSGSTPRCHNHNNSSTISPSVSFAAPPIFSAGSTPSSHFNSARTTPRGGGGGGSYPPHHFHHQHPQRSNSSGYFTPASSLVSPTVQPEQQHHQQLPPMMSMSGDEHYFLPPPQSKLCYDE